MSQSDAATSLLSLSIAAASASPILLQHQRSSSSDGVLDGPVSTLGNNGRDKTHRRLASTGKTRRRLSDAREAAQRPSPAALSLASLSLSTSPPSTTATDDASKPIPIVPGKKRAVEHKCESCSKIYRHPSCLIKHRWEHTPHWREASKFVLSKHQQVQLLEAAAILSHLSPTASSLPEDRSLWPSFLSGGSLPPPVPSALASPPDSKRTPATNGISTSGGNTGPRMHDYSIPINTTSTQLRPGLLGVPTSSIPVTTALSNSSQPQQPMSVPITTSHSWSSVSVSNATADSITASSDIPPTRTIGGWSLPRSSVRSVSASSLSRSRSASDDENEDGDDDDSEESPYNVWRRGAYSHHRTQWKREEDDSLREEDETLTNSPRKSDHTKDWDGMEMEMDMD